MSHRIGRFDRRDASEVELGTERHVRTEIVVVERVGLKPQSVSLRIDEHGEQWVGHEAKDSEWKTARSGLFMRTADSFSRRETPELRISIRRSREFPCLSAEKTAIERKMRRRPALSGSADCPKCDNRSFRDSLRGRLIARLSPLFRHSLLPGVKKRGEAPPPRPKSALESPKNCKSSLPLKTPSLSMPNTGGGKPTFRHPVGPPLLDVPARRIDFPPR